MNYVYVLQNLPFFLALIGPLIFFHELGHFLVAKAAGVRVLRFSLGFGPKLVAFKRGETEYVLAAIPLGGYVKMWGDDPSIELLTPEEQRGSFLHLALWKRAAIVIAGPAFNLLLAAVVYAGIFLSGMPDNSTKLGLVIAGGPAATAGLTPGDEVIGIDGKEVRFWSDLQRTIQENRGTPMKLEVKNAGVVRQVMVTPQLQDEQDDLRQKVKRGKIGISVYALAPLVDVVDEKSPAALAGVKTGDEITSVAGQPVSTWYEMQHALLAAKDANVAVVLKRKQGDIETSAQATLERSKEAEPRKDANLRPDPEGLYSGLLSYDARVQKVDPGTPAEKLGLKVGDRLISVEGKPINAWRFDLATWNGGDPTKDLHITYGRGDTISDGVVRFAETQTEDEMHTTSRAYVFGAENDPATLRGSPITRQYGAIESISSGIARTWETSRLTMLGTVYMLTGKLSRKEVGSVIMLFVVAEKAAARGVSTFLDVMALVSVSLGVMNLLPVPVLDGGHLMFIAAEAIRRKPLSMRARENAALVGLVLLLLLMAFAFFNDINKFILR